MFKLLSTGQLLFELTWEASAPQPWPQQYRRMIMPNGGIQIIRKDKMQKLKNKGLLNLEVVV